MTGIHSLQCKGGTQVCVVRAGYAMLIGFLVLIFHLFAGNYAYIYLILTERHLHALTYNVS